MAKVNSWIIIAVVIAAFGLGGIQQPGSQLEPQKAKAAPVPAELERLQTLKPLALSPLIEPPPFEKGPGAPVTIGRVSDGNWNAEVIDAGGLIVVCFTAGFDRNSPRQVEILSKLPAMSGVKVLVADIRQCPQAAGREKIGAFPSTLLFRQGRIVARFDRLTDEDALRKAVEANIR